MASGHVDVLLVVPRNDRGRSGPAQGRGRRRDARVALRAGARLPARRRRGGRRASGGFLRPGPRVAGVDAAASRGPGPGLGPVRGREAGPGGLHARARIRRGAGDGGRARGEEAAGEEEAGKKQKRRRGGARRRCRRRFADAAARAHVLPERALAPRRLGGGLDAGRARRARSRAGRRRGPLETVRVRPGGVHAVPGNHVVALAPRRRRRGPPRAARRPLRRPRAVRAPGRAGAGRGRRRRRRRARDAAARVPAGAARAARRPRDARAGRGRRRARRRAGARAARVAGGGGGGGGGAGGDARRRGFAEARRRRFGCRGAKRARRAGDAGEEAA